MTLDRSELKLILGALAGVCLSNFTIFSAPLYIGGLMDGMGFDEVQAGLTITLEIGAVASVTLLLSNWLDRISLRYLAMAGAVVLLLANIVTFYIDDYAAILISRTLAGAGAGLCLAASSALLSRMSDPDRVMGMLLAINTLIMVLMLTLMGYAKSRWMFNGFVGPFTLTVVVLSPFLLLIPAQPFSTGPKEQKDATEIDHHLALGSLGVGLLFFFCVIEGCVWAFSERSGINLGMDEGDIGMLLALAQIASLAGATLAAVFGEKIPRVFPISIGIILMGSSGLMIYQTQSTLIYSASLASFGFGFFIAFPYLVGACARLDPDGRWAARATGINLMGGAIAPFVAGNIIRFSNYQALGRFCLGLALFCLALTLLFNHRLNRANIGTALKIA